MSTLKPIAALALALTLAGCVPSLQPLYTEKDTVFDPALVGMWEKDKELWTLRAAAGGAYQLTVKPDSGPPASFQAHLVQLDSSRFLDLYPDEPETGNDFYQFHLIRAHSISRLVLDGDTLRVAMLQDGWLKTMLAEGKLQIAHEFVGPDRDLLLTAPTPQLQALVRRYAGDVKAFSDPAEYRRVK